MWVKIKWLEKQEDTPTVVIKKFKDYETLQVFLDDHQIEDFEILKK